jgi:hypothetical protein
LIYSTSHCSETSLSGKGDTPTELFRPLPPGRPIRLFDSEADETDAGSLDGGRIAMLD